MGCSAEASEMADKAIESLEYKSYKSTSGSGGGEMLAARLIGPNKVSDTMSAA